MAQETMVNPQTEKKSKGCFFWGCLTVVAVLLVGGIVTAVVAKRVVDAVTGILADEPAEFTLPEPTAEETDAATAKTESLHKAVEDGSGGRFALSEGELNALIAAGLKQSQMQDMKALVRIAEGKLSGEVSISAGEIIPQLDGKYLNGEATFSIRKTSAKDRLQVKIVEMQVRGNPVPKALLDELKTTNLMDEIYLNPKNKEARKILDSIESIEVDGDRIVFEVLEKAKPVEPAPKEE